MYNKLLMNCFKIKGEETPSQEKKIYDTFAR
ncbi:hypothetical protein SAMN05216480_101644 [Pustulibacterium marinum]|uniref:Uncharacterized protein n=1 Tax=Pustulibacterium marinum TaxID=1224947 RepID=A0A1I7F572_9FLAO|nr:hypothetical protein SAMN05216480_101644 [Pustulibacterium marinum]